MDIQSFPHASRKLRGLPACASHADRGQSPRRRTGGIGLPEVAYQREAFVQFTLNQDSRCFLKSSGRPSKGLHKPVTETPPALPAGGSPKIRR